MDAALAETTESALAAFARRVDFAPGRSFWVGTGEIEMMGPDLIDSNDPGRTFSGNLLMDFTSFGLKSSGPALDDEGALAVVMALALANELHEVAEWFKLDGERVFEPHTSSKREWTVLGQIAHRVAERALTDLPRSATPTGTTPGEAGRPAAAVKPVLPSRLAPLLARLSYLPGVRFSATGGNVTMESAVEGQSTAGTLALNLRRLLAASGPRPVGDLAAEVALTLAVVGLLQFVCEWLSVDGQIVFGPLDRSRPCLALLVDIAGEAATTMLADHPRADAVASRLSA